MKSRIRGRAWPPAMRLPRRFVMRGEPSSSFTLVSAEQLFSLALRFPRDDFISGSDMVLFAVSVSHPESGATALPVLPVATASFPKMVRSANKLIAALVIIDVMQAFADKKHFFVSAIFFCDSTRSMSRFRSSLIRLCVEFSLETSSCAALAASAAPLSLMWLSSALVLFTS